MGIIGNTLQRRPVPKNHSLAFGEPLFMAKPGRYFFTGEASGMGAESLLTRSSLPLRVQ